ncbi:MAG TPA: iron ABC transporter substrate-binding protein [Clostridiales bacterium]|nr:iron ABC transporter substrate-binding protein [Clostridiales bacterium]
MGKVKRGVVMFCALLFAAALLVSGCAASARTDWRAGDPGLGNGLKWAGSMELKYAGQFSVDYYEGGYVLLSVSDGSRFLAVPEGMEAPEGVGGDIVIIRRPADDIYLVATSAMCLFDALEALPNVSLSGSKAQDWYIENAKTAMQAGDILYAGKYNKPDYELILSAGCDLAVESTMINHTPEVKEKLEELGIPVLVEQSSYETHPLGRLEWIKLYAALLGKEELANQLFDEQVAHMESVSGQESTGKTVAFFYVSSNGSVVVRRSGDYITKMIELAGGDYVFENLGDPEKATSTVNMEMEQFYATAKEADYIIYNSTIDGSVRTLDDLTAKNELFGDFKAVQSGNVWCTDKNLFQETTQIGLMISDMHEMLTAESGLKELNFMYKLQ